MEDINALDCKLQDISKTLEAFQASVLVQDQQVKISISKGPINFVILKRIAKFP